MLALSRLRRLPRLLSLLGLRAFAGLARIVARGRSLLIALPCVVPLPVLRLVTLPVAGPVTSLIPLSVARLIPLPIPGLSRFRGVRLYVQYTVFDPAGPFAGFATFSDGLELLLGS